MHIRASTGLPERVSCVYKQLTFILRQTLAYAMFNSDEAAKAAPGMSASDKLSLISGLSTIWHPLKLHGSPSTTYVRAALPPLTKSDRRC